LFAQTFALRRNGTWFVTQTTASGEQISETLKLNRFCELASDPRKKLLLISACYEKNLSHKPQITKRETVLMTQNKITHHHFRLRIIAILT